MADKFSLNFGLQATNHTFSAVWRLTRVMKAAGWNVKAHSDGFTKQASGTNNNDSWGNSSDPLLDTYPSFDTAAAWIVMEGPKTLKFPLVGVPSGTFLRGESVTQSNTGATGEVLGVVWDSGTSSGWAIVMPRTGSFNGVDGVTGDTSAAGFIPSAMKTFTREVVFFKNTNITAGTCYYVCADQSAETASLFSSLASSAGCTATIAPGAGGTANAFPAIAITMRGTGGAVTHGDWFSTTSGFAGMANLVATNATPSAGVTVDGTFWALCSRTTPVGSFGLFGFFRLDDSEPGDVDPFVWHWSSNNSVSTYSRTSQVSFSSSSDFTWTELMAGTSVRWKGYAARDCPVTARDIATYFYGGYRNSGSQNSYQPSLCTGATNAHRLANHPAANPPYLRDQVHIITDASFAAGLPVRYFKGTVRWFQLASTGGYKDTYDGLSWLVVFPYNGSTNPSILLGPWDGSTTPT